MTGSLCSLARLCSMFAALAGGFCAAAASAGPGSRDTLGLRTGALNTSREPNEWAAIQRGGREGRRYVIQLDGPMRPEWQARLEAAGVMLGDYLPENAYVVNLDAADRAALRALGFVRWAGAFRGAWKLDPEFGRGAQGTQERRDLAARGLSAVEVTLFAGSPSDATVAAIQTYDGSAVHWTAEVGGHEVVCATMRSADVAALTDLGEVQFIEEAPEITLRNGTNRWIVQSNVNGSFPVYAAGIHGEGQIVGIIDTAVDRNQCAFRDDEDNTPGPLHRKIEAYNTGFSASSHGTHVAGICVGDAGADDNNRGVAYAGRLVYNSIPLFNEEAVKSRLDMHHGQGARIHTNSWGDDNTVAYNGLARGVDVFSYENEDDLVLFAVTNTSALKNPENAKNLLAVGASQDTPNQGTLCFGGAGPTNDGRRKPEIYAPGCQTNSAGAGTVCTTNQQSGTSMACPAVAGAGMLVQQYFTDGYYPTGAAVLADGFTPTGALIKAVLLNSAVDMTGIAGYPSNQEGWGRVLLNNALFFPGDASKLVVDDVRNADGLATAEAESYVFTVQAGTPLRVTLVWTDPPAALNANPASVNDLDLEMNGPLGAYKGNVFSGGQSAIDGVADSKNNVEQIYLTTPTAGSYAVSVRGTAVVDGLGEPFTQGYALVVSGNVAQSPDCNLNGTADAADIAAGTSQDADTNGIPDECDPGWAPAATVTAAASWKLHAVRGPQAITVDPLGEVDTGTVTTECRSGGISELHIGFDMPLSAGVTTLSSAAVSIEHQRTGDPGAGTSAGYTAFAYAGSISTAASVGSELVLLFTPALPNAATYRINIGSQVTSIPGQSVEVRGLIGDVDDSGRANGADRSAVVSVWTSAGYTVETDIDLSGATNASDRSAAVSAWTGSENSAP